MWQFRDNMVTIHDFAKSEDSLKIVLTEAKSRRTNFEEKIEDFMELNFLDQQIVCGDEGTSYNQLNPMIKGIYYYNYMALINNKDIKKLARGSEFEITPEKYDELNAKNDTILKYIKLYKGVEKHLYKEDKDFDKNSNSLTVDKDKINTKLVGTIVLFKDSIPLELLPKDAMEGLKKIEAKKKAAKKAKKAVSKLAEAFKKKEAKKADAKKAIKIAKTKKKQVKKASKKVVTAKKALKKVA